MMVLTAAAQAAIRARRKAIFDELDELDRQRVGHQAEIEKIGEQIAALYSENRELCHPLVEATTSPAEDPDDTALDVSKRLESAGDRPCDV